MSHDVQKTIATWYVDSAAEDRMSDSHAPIWRLLIDVMVERDLSEKSVLDFGCNQGGLLRHLYAIRPFRKALGIDIAKQSIAKAESLKGNLPVQHIVGGTLDGWVGSSTSP
jgi:2-polyprenyl-3-methyl-5-hydroxy-6-metoxy-1,4-benzoquinol methylase